MISVAMRSTSLASALKTSSQVVATHIKGIEPSIVLKTPTPCASVLDSDRVSNGNLKVSSGIGVSAQIRCYHRNMSVPDFSDVRRASNSKPNTKSADSVPTRNSFIYTVTLGNLIGAAYLTKISVRMALSTFMPGADVVAEGILEVKLSDIPEGKSMTFKWRGKPVFVRHRTEVEIERERAVDISSLRDPQHDNDRTIDPKFLVVVGICTHLGCVPIAGAGDFFGYYCPCHGSHYDGSGRVRKGPAPFNLEVPEHSYPEPNILQIGS